MDTSGHQSDDIWHWHWVADSNALDALHLEGSPRIHAEINGRFVSVIQHDGALYALDSVCFHAGGPLALGEIEELESGSPCLVCPWHYYRVALATGEKWYQSTQPSDEGKLVAGAFKSVGRRQRVHDVERRADGIYVRLRVGTTEDGEETLASDEYAFKQECGARIRHGALAAAIAHARSERPASPGRSGRASPAGSPMHGSPVRGSPLLEGEDVWPSDFMAADGLRRSSPHWRHGGSSGGR